jgi:hypothetical protein
MLSSQKEPISKWNYVGYTLDGWDADAKGKGGEDVTIGLPLMYVITCEYQRSIKIKETWAEILDQLFLRICYEDCPPNLSIESKNKHKESIFSHNYKDIEKTENKFFMPWVPAPLPVTGCIINTPK